MCQASAELLLPLAGHQKIPESAKALALVGVGNGIALTHDFAKQLTFAALPERDALAYLAIKAAKVVLHLTEISQQFAGDLLKLLEAVFQAGFIKQGDVARQNAPNFSIDRITPGMQLGDAFLRISLTAFAHLT